MIIQHRTVQQGTLMFLISSKGAVVPTPAWKARIKTSQKTLRGALPSGSQVIEIKPKDIS